MPYPATVIKRKLRNATTLHETNFRKLSRVIPGLIEHKDFTCLEVDEKTYLNLNDSISIKNLNNSSLSIRIVEASKFTKTFTLHIQHLNSHPWLPELTIKIRNYYDAEVTEVLAFQYHHRLDARYNYPNVKMHQRNEKWQTNLFLSEWLDHCIKTKCIFKKMVNTSEN